MSENEKRYKTIDEMIAASERGELPKGAKAIDMRKAAFALIVQWDGALTLRVKCSDVELIRALREIADEVEMRSIGATTMGVEDEDDG